MRIHADARVTSRKAQIARLGMALLVLAMIFSVAAPSSAAPPKDLEERLPIVAGRALGVPEGSPVQVLFSPDHPEDGENAGVPGEILELPQVALEKTDREGYFGLYPSDSLSLSDLPMDVTVLVYGDKRVFPYNIVLERPGTDGVTGDAIVPTLEIDASPGDRATFRYSDRSLRRGELEVASGQGRVLPSDVILPSGQSERLSPIDEVAQRPDVGLRLPMIEETVEGAPVAQGRILQLRGAAGDDQSMSSMEAESVAAMATLTREYIGNVGDFRTILQTTGTNSSWVGYQYYFNHSNTSGDSFQAGIGFSQSGSKGSFTSAGRLTRSSSVEATFGHVRTVGRYHMYGDVRYGRYRLKDVATGAVYGYELRARGVPGGFWRSGRLSNSYPTHCTVLGSQTWVTRSTSSTIHWSNGVSVEGWGASLQVLQTLGGGYSHRISFKNHANATNKYVCGSRTTIGDTSTRAGTLMGDHTNR